MEFGVAFMTRFVFVIAILMIFNRVYFIAYRGTTQCHWLELSQQIFACTSGIINAVFTRLLMMAMDDAYRVLGSFFIATFQLLFVNITLTVVMFGMNPAFNRGVCEFSRIQRSTINLLPLVAQITSLIKFIQVLRDGKRAPSSDLGLKQKVMAYIGIVCMMIVSRIYFILTADNLVCHSVELSFEVASAVGSILAFVLDVIISRNSVELCRSMGWTALVIPAVSICNQVLAIAMLWINPAFNRDVCTFSKFVRMAPPFGVLLSALAVGRQLNELRGATDTKSKSQ